MTVNIYPGTVWQPKQHLPDSGVHTRVPPKRTPEHTHCLHGLYCLQWEKTRLRKRRRSHSLHSLHYQTAGIRNVRHQKVNNHYRGCHHLLLINQYRIHGRALPTFHIPHIGIQLYRCTVYRYTIYTRKQYTFKVTKLQPEKTHQAFDSIERCA